MSTARYFVTRNGEPEREVSKQEFCYAERSAGFHLGHGPDDITKTATGGFTGNGIRGRIKYVTELATERER